MAGINIPGVNSKYGSNETVEKLMQVERIPLTREKETLEQYEKQQDAWRNVNKKASSLRDSVKSLYSFENPFNSKVTKSSDENAVTATASRNATYEDFKIDVVQVAQSDKYLSGELDKDTSVPPGSYTYKVADKKISFKWNGGSLQDFSKAINKRGGDLIRSRVLTTTKGRKAITIESQKTGASSPLSFEDDALTFAISSGMVEKTGGQVLTFGSNINELRLPPKSDNYEMKGMPEVNMEKVSVTEEGIKVPSRSGYKINIPSLIKDTNNTHLTFTLTVNDTEDITTVLNAMRNNPPIFPETGSASFNDIVVNNAPPATNSISEGNGQEPNQYATSPEYSKLNRRPDDLNPIETTNVLYVLKKDGTEEPIDIGRSFNDLVGGKVNVDIDLGLYENASAIVMNNRNTAKEFIVSPITVESPSLSNPFNPLHPISKACDSIVKYEGITIKRPSNSIDDIIPEVTLNIQDVTQKSAKISILPDKEAAKDALITFVGKYNQAIAEINILSQNKAELVDEIDYYTDEEKEEKRKVLGLFLSDSTLTGLKSSVQAITQANYRAKDDAAITLLSQLGIATNASYSGYTPGKLRGYLEIDEKKLDNALENNIDDIRNIFGFDSDGDLIVDSGLAYNLDKQLTSYVQTGGLFSLKTAGLDGKIKGSKQKITKLEEQLDKKEAELKARYSQMEGTLNSLEAQQTTIQNFSNKNNKQQ